MLTHKGTSNNKRKLDEAYYNRSISEFKKLTVNLTIGMGIAALEINILENIRAPYITRNNFRGQYTVYFLIEFGT